MVSKDFAKVLYGYRVAFVVLIVWASAQTLRSVLAAPQSPQYHYHLVIWLAPLEIVVALAFLFPTLELVAGGLLWFVFAIAALHEILSGEVPVHLIFYALTVWIIVYAHRHRACFPGQDFPSDQCLGRNPPQTRDRSS